MSHPRSLAAAGLATLLTLQLAVAGAPVVAAEDAPKILLVLDASGSMKEADPSGLTKIDAAKKALTHVVDTIPAGTQVGLRVYGATQPGGKPTPAACADTQLVHPITALDQAGLKKAIGSFTARGETPIAHSLTEGAKDLGATGKRHIILVSDGEESCVPDPCPEIKKLTGLGIDLTIDTVGFNVTDKAKKQLSCIAETSGGAYYDAKNSADLDNKLQRLANRAARMYTTQGTPVVGTTDAATAPVLTPGQYTDTLRRDPAKPTVQRYRIHRTIQNSNIAVNFSGRMYRAGLGPIGENWNYFFDTADGQPCTKLTANHADWMGPGTVISDTLELNALNPKWPTVSKETQACADATDLVVTVERPASEAKAADVEITVTEEPTPENVASLPETPQWTKVESFQTPTGTPKPVVLGTSFTDAPALEPGLYSTEIVPGEQVFAKFLVQHGQSAVFRNLGPDPSDPNWRDRPDNDQYQVLTYLYNPVRSRADTYQVDTVQPGQRSRVMTQHVQTVNYRNRYDTTNPETAYAGYYYGSFNLNRYMHGAGGTPARFTFAVVVQGTPTNVPIYPATRAAAPAAPSAGPVDTPSPTASATPTPTDVPSATPTPSATATAAPPTAPTATAGQEAPGGGTTITIGATSGPEARTGSAVPSAPAAIGIGLVMAAVVGGAAYLKRRRG